MDTFRKWLNKPKADDKSLLARFYHADRSLTAISSELDSFDGRAEPDRCSRLVSRLRQGQDKVLSITNQIMEELLGEDRAPRAFRAKFPEEVLQENLAGQLWFGAECLSAGSSIMNREQESKDMRPLAQAVTKSLGNVRNLLRDQCLRNNVPNSQTLHLDFNDSNTEQLYESLKIFDRLFAEFELRYVSAMVQVKTKHEYEMQEFICVLFSETLQRALTVGLLEQEKVDAFDPGLMFSIPRLAIVAGLVIYSRGPLNMDMPADQLSEMFRPYRSFLIKIRDLLRKLNKNELYQLEKLLCTDEDVHVKVVNNGSAGDNDTKNNNNCDDDAATTSSSSSTAGKNDNDVEKEEDQSTAAAAPELKEDINAVAIPVNDNDAKVLNENGVFANTDVFSMSSSSEASTPSVSPSPSPLPSTSSTTSSAEWTDDENAAKEGDIVSADCATGYLIPNTNLGNLLQSNEVPLTDNFIASEDDEFPEGDLEVNGNIPSCSRILAAVATTTTPTTVVDSSEESEQLTIKGTEGESFDSRDSQYAKLEKSSVGSGATADGSGKRSHRHHHHHHHHSHRRHHHHHHHHQNNSHSSSVGTSSSASSSASSSSSNSSSSGISKGSLQHSKKRSKNNSTSIATTKRDTSSGDTASSLSDGDPHEVTLALRAAGRMKFVSTEYLLHRLFVSIASVADQLQTNFASDLRQILRSVFLMNMSPAQDEIEIPEKNTKDTTAELFEFRASENDVIQQQSAGSNQSIYSAEEVNPELDNVFNSTDRPPVIQRGHTIDLAASENPPPSVPVRNNIGRSRSLGEEASTEVSPNTSQQRRHGTLSSYMRERRLSSGSRSPANSSTSTASNSPVSERSAAHYTAVANNNLNNNTNHSNNTIIHNNNNNNNNNSAVDVPMQQTQSPQIRLSPPVWVPDDKAPRCMSCTTPFTAFRRRHHCRNCGGVFCGVCSSASTPLPKFGLTKAVRVCRDCFIYQLTA